MILTCDDFGIHKDIDKSIIQLCKKKKVDAVSVICCGKSFSNSSKSLLKYRDDISIGIHATWVEEKSISKIKNISSLITKNNYFNHNFKSFYIKWLFGLVSLKHLEIELENQILKMMRVFGRIDHLDSHQHIHMIPEIFKLCINMAEKYEIPRIRIVDEIFTPNLNRIYDPIKLIGEKCLKVWAKKNRKYLKKSSIKSTRSFFGVRYSGNFDLIQDYLKSMIKERREEDIEINFHPAHITQSLLSTYPWYKNGNIDFDILNIS